MTQIYEFSLYYIVSRRIEYQSYASSSRNVPDFYAAPYVIDVGCFQSKKLNAAHRISPTQHKYGSWENMEQRNKNQREKATRKFVRRLSIIFSCVYETKRC